MGNPSQRRAYLDAMGIQVWVRRNPTPSEGVPASVEIAVPEASPEPMTPRMAPPALRPAVDGLDWDGLAATVANCTACELYKTRTHTVFGVGDRHAQWMIIGEAPGAEEDQQGEPFVGRAGQLLNNMLKAVGLAREAVYIANILKCRPPGNRDPHVDEAVQCEFYLRRQVELLKPQLILAVGRIAAQNLLKVETPLGKLRGQVHRYNDIPVVVTYHPAYLLRTLKDKAKAWEDLRFALAVSRGEAG